MKKSNKIIIIILVILIIYFLILFLFLGGSKRVSREKNQNVIILGQSTIWTYSKNIWTNVTLSETKENLNWQEYNVYIDNKKLGKYYLWHDENKWYLFDKDRKPKNYNGDLLAYKSNFDMKIKNFEEKNIEDYTYIEQVLKNNNIELDNINYTVNSQIDIDIDNDGEEETFYVVSNALSLENTDGQIFSIVIMVKDNKIYKLYNDIKTNKLKSCKPYIRRFLDVDNDNTLETILSCGGYSESGDKDFLYKFTDKNNYKIIISNT